MADTFTIAFVEGVTLTKWTRAWTERTRRRPLGFVPTTADDQLDALRSGDADVAFVRSPVQREGLSLIPLYEEAVVAVASRDHLIAAADELLLGDLVGEHPVPSGLASADAVAVAAAGGGFALLPQSVARLHARKDVVSRPVSDAAPTRVGLAWPEDRTTPDVELFIGIVRGRTPNSSR